MASDGPSPALKLIVYSMGIMLVGGMILLAVLVMQRLNDGTLFQKKPEQPGAPAAATCSGTEIDMRGRGILRDAATEGQKVTLWFEGANGMHRLVVADACSGALIREITVQTDH